jgi:hypothetical protein
VGQGGGLHAGGGAAVMAASIISVGLHLIGHETLSLIALAVGAAWWILLAAAFTATLLRARAEWVAAAGMPPGLTAVAATAVLGTRTVLLGWREAATALLVLAVLLWPGLTVRVVRRLSRGMAGGVFLIAVPAQAIAVLGTRLSLAYGSGWLGSAALACFCLGLALYVVALMCFDFRQVLTGFGDQWVAGGALAIAALESSALLSSPQWAGSAHRTLHAVGLVLLVSTFTWYAVLFLAEVYRPRPGYDVRRWSTIFPLGMIAAASLSLAAPLGIAWLEPLGRVLLWIALGAWLLTFAGLLHLSARARAPA